MTKYADMCSVCGGENGRHKIEGCITDNPGASEPEAAGPEWYSRLSPEMKQLVDELRPVRLTSPGEALEALGRIYDDVDWSEEREDDFDIVRRRLTADTDVRQIAREIAHQVFFGGDAELDGKSIGERLEILLRRYRGKR